MMRLRIKSVVYGNADLRARFLISPNHRIAAPICQHHVEPGDACVEWIGFILAETIERRRRVHVPKDHAGTAAFGGQYLMFEQFIEYADTTRFDHAVRRPPGGFECVIHTVGTVNRVNANLCPVRRVDITVLLALERVRLIERDLVPKRMKISDDATVISRGSIPVGGQQAGTKERNLQRTVPPEVSDVVVSVD